MGEKYISHPGPRTYEVGDNARISQEDIRKALSRIPPDTRKPFQRMMGDPMPGRSAYDQMRRGV